jgi:VPDSG-CTERM exosortase interaction domain
MKNLTKTILILIAAGFALTALSTQEAQATQITGRLDLAGAVMFDSSALQNVTQVNQWRDINGNIGFSNVAAFNGSYVGHVILGQQVTMSGGNSFPAWVFNPSTPTDPLWEVGGFTFHLTSATVVMQDATFLNIKGVGTVSGNGFEDTTAKWAFTVQNAGGGTGDFFSFSANTAAQGVPDGGSTVSLLSFGLLGLAALRSKLSC